MQISPEQIELIVRSVLQQVQKRPETIPAEIQASDTKQSGPTVAIPSQPATLSLVDRVITTQTLLGRLEGVKRVTIAKRTVVTPAARDLLRDKKIALESVENKLVQVESAKRTKVVVIGPIEKTKLSSREGFATSNDFGVDAPTLTRIGSEISAGSHVLWCTPKPFAAVQAACTVAGVQAIQLPDYSQLKQAVLEATPNLIVIDEKRWSIAAVGNLARAWQRRSR